MLAIFVFLKCIATRITLFPPKHTAWDSSVVRLALRICPAAIHVCDYVHEAYTLFLLLVNIGTSDPLGDPQATGASFKFLGFGSTKRHPTCLSLEYARTSFVR